MDKNIFKRMICLTLALLLVASTVFSMPVVPEAKAAAQEQTEEAQIQKLEGLEVDLTKYFDSSKVMPLADTIADHQEISVIITVDVTSLMDAYEGEGSFKDYALYSEDADAIQAQIQAEKLRILSELDERKVCYTQGADYSVILSGFEIVIQAGDFDVVCQSLGDGEGIIVSEVYERAETQLVENTVNVYEGTGIFNSSASGYDGSGMVVAVLDTGLDSNHSAFSVDNFTSDHLGMTYEDVAAVLADTRAYAMNGNLGVDDVYINEKVPFGYDYADNDPDVYSTHNNHGTHVSGVIVGKDDTITGVAPNAQLVSMKTFSDIMDTARSTWILSALEDCVVLDVDVVNMSLGTACGFARESDEEIMNGVYDKLRGAGISVVVAASNSFSSAYGSEANGNLPLTSNPDTGTVGSPGTYQGVLSVASINGEETPYIKYGDTIIYFDESNNNAAKENDFFESLLGDEESKTFEYVVIPGIGRSADYTGLDMAGKIALVRRGDNTFEEKAIIAEEKGAAGIIVYNNVSGEIKMNVGDAKLATCSISQNDGELLAAAGSGKVTISKSQTSGPFISDFSSWGPTPSLNIKPEITAHGGNILSAVTGGSYDRLSGTSMACPNLAGVVILLRQYVVENFPAIANDNVKVNEMVNRLMMSTADIANSTNGLPYAVRKQGAGLANLMNAINTPAILVTYDRDGNAMDKTKLELGDDPQKTGVYTMNFDVHNFGSETLTYELGSYVFTEGVSETLTNAGKTTVTEEAFLLEGAEVSFSCGSGGTLDGKKLTVEGGSDAKLSVTITLTEENKQYLNESFANGMYVEGYITLKATKGTDVNLSVPYLAFYGDWTVAPMFDLSYYETNADELDEGIDEEDKTKADAYATRPIGGVMEDFVSYLGSYYFLQDPKDMPIAATRDYIALSNKEGSIHSLRFVWAGLLRNAQRIEIKVTDDTTGEVIFETVDTDVRKSYGDGGSIYPANIEVEFDTQDYNLPNNSQLTVTLTGYMEYGADGGIDTNSSNVFTFPLYVDFEAPTVTDVEYYSEYDQAEKKNRLYAKVSIYDNHYTMSAGLGYVGTGTDENDNQVPELKNFEQFMTPVFSKRDSTTVVTYELTDYLFEIKENSLNPNAFVVTAYDYALNYATYEIPLPDDFVDFYFESLEDGLTISPNEVYTLEPIVTPDTQWGELLEVTSNKPSVVRVVNNKLVGASSGKAVIRVRDPQSGKSMTFTVTVLSEGDEGYMRYDKPVADTFNLTGYQTIKSYYQIDSKDKLIGDAGDVRFFEGNYELSMYPSESVRLNHDLDAFYPNKTTVVYETSNDKIVAVDSSGTVTAKAEGFASITVKVLLEDKSTYYSQSISVEVKNPFVNNGASLTHYYGMGGTVTFPEDLDVTEIGNFAFANFEYILKTEEELAFDDAETSKQWYIGDATITKVILPEGIEKIGAYSFANLTALEEIVLPSTLEFIEYGAFYGCSSLEKVTFSGENNLKVINQSAFEGCDLQGTLDLSSICMISPYAFAGNKGLKEVITGDTLLSVGDYAFAGCQKLETVTITAPKVKYGPYAFTDCEALKSFYVNAAVLPEGMFYECTGLESVSIGPDVKDIGSFAFRDTSVATFEIKEGNTTYKAGTAAYILSADSSELVAVSPMAEGSFTESNIGGARVTSIAKGAFSHNRKLTAVELPNVARIGAYGMGSSENIATVTLGKLTYVGEYAFFETSISELPQMASDTVIEKYAFSHTKLTNVVISNGATVSEGAFSQCMELGSVIIGDDVVLEDYAFNMDKDSIFNIEHYDEDGERYFYYEFASGLKELTIGENVTIGENAFAGHASLEAVTLGSGANIGYMAFYNCDSLRDIDLSRVASIGDYAFSGDVYYVCLDDSMSVAAVSKDGHYIYTYHAPNIQYLDLTSLDAIGEYAFAYCRELEEVQLSPEMAEIPAYAFAGCIALKTINTENVTAVGDYAFIESEQLVSVDLSNAATVGEFAFVYGDALESVVLNPEGTDLGEGAFSYCEKLTQVENMGGSKNLGDYAFAYTGVTDIDLTGAESVGTHAFMKEELTKVTVKLGSSLAKLGENPFAMCKVAPFTMEIPEETTELEPTGPETTVPETTEPETTETTETTEATETTETTETTEAVTTPEETTAEETTEPETTETVGARTAEPETTEATEAETTEVTEPETTEVEETEPETTEPETTEGETEATEPEGTEPQLPENVLSGTFDITETVRVADGSLYCKTVNGWELVTYAGNGEKITTVAPETVRITALAFAGSDVRMVSLPYTVAAVGHKAFYGCENLEQVIFASYNAPILEEEFDSTYYESLEHMPGTGDFGTYADYEGNEVVINGIGLIPYYMWNATDGMYSNVFYGANFVDYVGYVEQKLTMVRPVNGQNYETYIYGQYFDLTIDGANAADDTTLAAIAAINAIPERVTWDNREVVAAARAAYNKIATLDQQALVTNYTVLTAAEQRVNATNPENQTSEEPTETPETTEPESEGKSKGFWGWILGGLAVIGGAIAAFFGLRKKKGPKDPDPEGTPEEETSEEEQTEETVEETTEETPDEAEEAGEEITEEVTEEETEEAPEEVQEQVLAEEAPEAVLTSQVPQEVTDEEAEEESEEETEEESEEESEEETEEAPEKKSINWRKIFKIGLVAVLAALLIAGICLMPSCSGAEDPYTINNKDGYTVSVKFDANGGQFTTNTSVFVDSYKIDGLMHDGSGMLQLPVLAPDSTVRELDAYTAVNNGYFLAGWYSERIENTDASGNTYYTYAGQWDFATSRVSVDPNKDYSASEPVLTLYAMWVPLFQVEFYDVDSGELLATQNIDPRTEATLTVPAWNLETGAMDMGKFPNKVGYTFECAYMDAEGTQPVEGETVAHTGTLDATTGEATGTTMKLYVRYTEGTWYKISTAEQFLGNANPSGSYEILEDLDFDGQAWPANLMYNEFTGKILGNGHTFSNITVDVNDNTRTTVGLFGSLGATAQMENVTFRNVTLNIRNAARMAGTAYGLFAGSVAEGAAITNTSILEGKIFIDPNAYFMTDDYVIGLVTGIGTADLTQAQVESTSDPAAWLVNAEGQIVPNETGEVPTQPVEETTEATTDETTGETTDETTEETTEATTGETTDETTEATTGETTDETTETTEATEA